MPRLARLDTPGVLHHVMGRGIERRKIFQSDTDRNDFIDRLSALARDGALEIYAWVLMPNPQILMMILTPLLSEALNRVPVVLCPSSVVKGNKTCKTTDN
jgi:REP element-mobilizing transposase RayT